MRRAARLRSGKTDLLVVGGGTGGVAAALAAAALGCRVVLTEETDWLGGQLTAQAVPPDEHPWIEHFGCTSRYRAFRDAVRHAVRAAPNTSAAARRAPHLNPGGGWVSKLCFDPRVGERVLRDMLEPNVQSGLVQVLTGVVPVAAEVRQDRVSCVRVRDVETGAEADFEAAYVLDATELGDLLPMTGTEYLVGAESQRRTGEPHAKPADEPANVQAITWVFAMAHDPGSHRVIDRPEEYERWRAYRPPFWPGPLLGPVDLHPITGEPRELPFTGGGLDWFTYRQVIDPSVTPDEPHPVTIVNWPMNDYFVGSIIDVPEEVKAQRLHEARQLSLSLLYWLQTEMDLPGLYLRPDVVGTPDGLAKAPYIRESRRIVARHTVLEQHVATESNPGRDRAPDQPCSIGVGAYRIDLHPSTGGDSYLDVSSLPFQIPLGSLVPVRMRNFLPACKNLGVTHITNGCYRLHPVEWNIGEAAGMLAAFCVVHGREPSAILESARWFEAFRSVLRHEGVETEWPRLGPL